MLRDAIAVQWKLFGGKKQWLRFAKYAGKVLRRATMSVTQITRPKGAGIPIYNGCGQYRTAWCAISEFVLVVLGRGKCSSLSRFAPQACGIAEHFQIPSISPDH